MQGSSAGPLTHLIEEGANGYHGARVTGVAALMALMLPAAPVTSAGPLTHCVSWALFIYIFLLITLILEVALGVSVYYSFLILMLGDWAVLRIKAY